MINKEQLHKDILAVLPPDPIAAAHLANPDPLQWSISASGLLLLDERICVPNADNLRLHVLQYKHDHVLSGHLGQNKTIELIRREYVWPGL